MITLIRMKYTIPMSIVMSIKPRCLGGLIACVSLSVLSACKTDEVSQTVTADPVMKAVSFDAPDRRALSSSGKYYHSNLVLVDESSQCSFPQSEDDTNCIRNKVPDQYNCDYTGVLGCWGNNSKYICMFDCVELKKVDVTYASQ